MCNCPKFRHRKCGCKWMSSRVKWIRPDIQGEERELGKEKVTRVCDKHKKITQWTYMKGWVNVEKWKKPQKMKCGCINETNAGGIRITSLCKNHRTKRSREKIGW